LDVIIENWAEIIWRKRNEELLSLRKGKGQKGKDRKSQK